MEKPKRIRRTQMELHPDVANALGFQWLLRFMRGESIKDIAHNDHRHRTTIRRYMRKAAAKLVDSAQEKVMDELFPLAVQVMKAQLEQTVERIQQGETGVDLALAERIMKGMYVLDAPSLKDQVAQEEEGADAKIESLTGFMIRRTRAPKELKAPQPQLEEGDVIDVKSDEDPTHT